MLLPVEMTDEKQRMVNPELDFGKIGRLYCHCRESQIQQYYYPDAQHACPFFGKACPNLQEFQNLTRQQFIDKYYPFSYMKIKKAY